ncbi:hypothetical protein ABZP36_005843 [Zizania latifolia]
MEPSEADKPLRRIAASFEELAAVAKQQPPGAMEVGAFARACSHVSVLFGCLGIAFKFAEMDYVAKARRHSPLSSPSLLSGLLSSSNRAFASSRFRNRDLDRARCCLDQLNCLLDVVELSELSTPELFKARKEIAMWK